MMTRRASPTARSVPIALAVCRILVVRSGARAPAAGSPVAGPVNGALLDER